MAEMSNWSLILSETRTPPVSSAAFQVSPQSLRSRVAEPSKPIRVLPKGSWAEPVNSKGTEIGLVTPLMVRSPVIVQSSPSRDDVGRGEGDVRELLALEEVGGEQVAVALLVAGADAVGDDAHLDLGVGRVRGVDVRGAGELGELAADGGDHRVPGAEAESAVRGVEGVVAGDVVEDGGGGVEVGAGHEGLLVGGLFDFQ